MNSYVNGDRLRVALIGCGGIAASRHVPAWQSIGNAALVAVADQNRKRADELAKRARVRSYSTLADMLSCPGLDVVDVVTPVNTHSELAVQALEAGKDVIVEKPMASTSTECDRMINAARNNGRKLLVAHTFRYYPAIRALKKWIEDGKLGPVRLLSSVTGNDGDPMHPLWREALWEFGAHRIDLVRYLLGEISSIHVDLLRENDLSIRLETRNGCALLGIVQSCAMEHLRVVAERGDIWIPSLALDVFLPDIMGFGSYSARTVKTDVRRWFGFGRCLGYSALRHSLLGIRATAHYSCLSDFARSLLTGYPALVSADDGRESVSCLERVAQIVDSKTNRSTQRS